MPGMSQAERISRIQFLLRAKKVVSMGELRATFEVSRATLMRDIELMRDRLGTPLVYDAAARGYRLAAHADPFEPLDELPGLWLTAREAYGMLTMFNVVKALDPGFLLHSIEPMRGVFKRMLSTMGFRMLGLDQKVAIELPDFAAQRRSDLGPLFEALILDQPVHLTWQPADAPQRDADCSVHKLMLRPQGWWLTLTALGGQRFELPLAAIVRCREVAAAASA